jgi:hypothetical protein
MLERKLQKRKAIGVLRVSEQSVVQRSFRWLTLEYKPCRLGRGTHDIGKLGGPRQPKIEAGARLLE